MDAHTGVLDTGELWRLTMEHSPVGMALVSPGRRDPHRQRRARRDARLRPRRARAPHGRRPHPPRRPRDRPRPHAAGDGRVDDVLPRAQAVLPLRRQPPAGRAVGAPAARHRRCAAAVHHADHRPHRGARLRRAPRRRRGDRPRPAEQGPGDPRRASRSGLLLVDADGTYSAWNRRQQELLDIAFPDGHGGRAGADAASCTTPSSRRS